MGNIAHPTCALGTRFVVEIRHQNPVGSAIGVFVLFVLHRPNKERQTYAAKDQGNRDQDGQDFHGAYFKRSALSDTVIEDRLIAKAAARGVAKPISAKGTATTL